MSETINIELSEELIQEIYSEYVNASYDGTFEKFLGELVKLGLKNQKPSRARSLLRKLDLSDYQKEFGKERAEQLEKELHDWIWLLHTKGLSSTAIAKKIGFKYTRLVRHIVTELKKQKEKQKKKHPSKFLKAY